MNPTFVEFRLPIIKVMQVAKTSTEPDQGRDRRWLRRLWPSRYTRPHRPRPSGKRDSAVAKGQDPL